MEKELAQSDPVREKSKIPSENTTFTESSTIQNYNAITILSRYR